MSALAIAALVQQLSSTIEDVTSKNIGVHVQDVLAHIDKNKGSQVATTATTLLDALLLYLQQLGAKPVIHLVYSSRAILDDLDDFEKLLTAVQTSEGISQQKVHIRSVFSPELNTKLQSIALLTDAPIDPIIQNELPTNLSRVPISGNNNEGKEVFSTVLRGTSVAVKLLKAPETGLDPEILGPFRKEIKIATSLSSPNIVQVLGAYISDQGIAIVMELLGGNLRQLLEKGPLPLHTKLRIAKEVADGIAFLHTHNPPLLHRNISSQHILYNNLTEQHCKVAGFGVSKFSTDPKSYVAGQQSKGTVGYKAPELWDMKDPKYSEKSDVYAFGVLLWELVTQQEPRKGLRPAVAAGEIVKGKLEAIPDGTPADLAKLITSCQALKAEDRPTLAEASRQLDALAAGCAPAATAAVDELTTLREENKKMEAKIKQLEAEIATLKATK